MATITIDQFPVDSSPVKTDGVHARTAGSMDEFLLLSTLQAWLHGLDSTKVGTADFNTLTTPGVYRNTSVTNSPDGGGNEFMVIVFPYAANALQVLQIAIESNGDFYTRTQNSSNVWTAWHVIMQANRGFTDDITKNITAAAAFGASLTQSGKFIVSGYTSGAPDGIAGKTWGVDVNSLGVTNPGTASATQVAIAIRQDTGDVWSGAYASSTWTWVMVTQIVQALAADYNTLTATGIYANASATNSPDASNNSFTVTVLANVAGTARTQIAVRVSDGVIYSRSYSSSTWTSWWTDSTGTVPYADNSSIDSGGVAWAAMVQLLNKSIKAGFTFSKGVVGTFPLTYTVVAAYQGGVLGIDGSIYFIPCSATVGQKILSNGTVTTFSLVYTIAGAYQGGVLV